MSVYRLTITEGNGGNPLKLLYPARAAEAASAPRASGGSPSTSALQPHSLHPTKQSSRLNPDRLDVATTAMSPPAKPGFVSRRCWRRERSCCSDCSEHQQLQRALPEHLPSRQGAAGRLGARQNLLVRLIVYQTAGASFCRDGGGGSLGLAVPFSPVLGTCLQAS